MKCSFCEQPLVCKSCGHAFHPRSGESRVAVYQPDVEVLCPDCQKVLVCQSCGFIYGEDQSEEQ